MPSRTIRLTEAPVPAPFAYTVAATEGFSPEAVSAQWDGSGAAGDFLPCVSYYNADGVLLDRAFPSGVTLTTGDTAEASYRPFDRSGGATAPVAATGYEAIIDNTGVLVAPNTVTFLPWFKDFGDDLLGLIGTNQPTLAAAGTYAITVFASGGVAAAAYDLDMEFRVPRSGATFQSFVASAHWRPAGVSGIGPVIAVTKTFAAGDSLDVQVEHNAAAGVRVALTAAVALNP